MTYQTIIPFTPALEKRFQMQLKKTYVGHSDMKKRRPELYNINVTENGSIQMTNSFVAVQLENTDAQPTHLERYPDMTNIFNLDRLNMDNSVMLYWEDLKILENQLNVIYKQKVVSVKIAIHDEGVTIENTHYNQDFIKSQITTEVMTDRDHTIKLNPRFLHDALMFFRQIYKDAYGVRLWFHNSNMLYMTKGDMTYVIVGIR